MVGLAKKLDLFRHWKLLSARMNYEYKILEVGCTRKIKENLLRPLLFLVEFIVLSSIFCTNIS